MLVIKIDPEFLTLTRHEDFENTDLPIDATFEKEIRKSVWTLSCRQALLKIAERNKKEKGK